MKILSLDLANKNYKDNGIVIFDLSSSRISAWVHRMFDKEKHSRCVNLHQQFVWPELFNLRNFSEERSVQVVIVHTIAQTL